MNSDLLSKWGVDPGIVILVLAGLVVVLAALVIYYVIRSGRLFRDYERFMRGKNGADLESTLHELTNRVERLQNQDMANKDMLRVLNRKQINAYQKTGIKKYNAFEGMGGMASFAIALLDLENNGVILNVIHSRNSCYTYLKEIKEGECEVALSAEEKAALMQATRKKDRFYDKDEDVLEE
nr:DUF4446 family protein [Lachnospiraceae bacterium]